MKTISSNMGEFIFWKNIEKRGNQIINAFSGKFSYLFLNASNNPLVLLRILFFPSVDPYSFWCETFSHIFSSLLNAYALVLYDCRSVRPVWVDAKLTLAYVSRGDASLRTIPPLKENWSSVWLFVEWRSFLGLPECEMWKKF